MSEDTINQTSEAPVVQPRKPRARSVQAAEEPESGLHNVVPVGSQLTLTAGSAARVFAAYAPVDAPFNDAELKQVRDDGFAESVAEREVGLASVSTPVFQPDGALVAVLSISGPVERLGPSPAAKWGAALKDATARLSAGL